MSAVELHADVLYRPVGIQQGRPHGADARIAEMGGHFSQPVAGFCLYVVVEHQNQGAAAGQHAAVHGPGEVEGPRAPVDDSQGQTCGLLRRLALEFVAHHHDHLRGRRIEQGERG